MIRKVPGLPREDFRLVSGSRSCDDLVETITASPMPPTLTNGKICYVEIPAVDAHRSSQFYEKVFGWVLRKRGDGAIAFDDAIGGVSGTWVIARPPSPSPGLLIYVMVDSVTATLESIIANGGEIVQPIGGDAPEITARFRDPAGNVLGLYQEPSHLARELP
jgi:predicted enzyme related to lactoylglutathione lyase